MTRLGWPLLGALTIAILFLTASLVVTTSLDDSYQTNARAGTVQSLSTTQLAVHDVLDQRLAVVDGLAALVNADPALTDDAFRRYAETLRTPGVRSIQLAPNAVVTYVHPLEGNEEAVGHDLLADPARRDVTRATIAAGDTVLTGPVDLVQGGQGFIARRPVHLATEAGDDPLWGLAVVVLDAEPILQALQPDPGATALDVFLEHIDPAGEAHAPVHGDPTVTQQDPVQTTIPLPVGAWRLSAVPEGGWPAHHPQRPLALGTGVFVALVASATTFELLARPQRLEKAVNEATRDLEARTSQLDTLVAGLPNGVLVETEDRRVLRANQAFLDLFNIPGPPSALEGADCRQAAQATAPAFAEPEAWLASLESCMQGGTPVLRTMFEAADGRLLERDYLPVRFADHGLGHIWQYRDVTQLRENERRLAQVNDRLRELDQLKTELLNTAAHQLKTPLTPLIMQVHMLDQGTLGELSEPQREAVDILSRNVTRLDNLVRDLLDVSRIQTGYVQLDPGPLTLAPLVDDVVQAYAPVLQTEGVEVHMEVPAGLEAHADPERVRQIVENLLSNAVKYADENVRVRAREQGGRVVVEVSDDGVGLDADQQAQLFQPFTSVHDDGATAKAGTGLGLYICKGFVEAHGGRLSCQSGGVGRGSTFSFDLPVGARDGMGETDPRGRG